jgi:predicted nuclease of predicted toxin-antitoxin system
MKLLFDQNLSPDLVARLKDLFPDSNHVYLLGLDRADDIEVRSFAGSNNFTIVTKDADYSEMHSLVGAHPKSSGSERKLLYIGS